ncbi:hypothetical protein HPULCUR_006030 [Helicostylum pulchrum]|uniref:Uncharacterized protein n=1 Tax=Helicostylum pulchrum TaxID=562976 RepID=A0ABP9Y0R1_9FUNG
MEDIFGRVASYEIRCALYDFDLTHMGCFYNFPKSIQTEATKKGCKALVSTENYLDGSLVRCVSYCQDCCLLLGEEVTEADRIKCKSIVKDTPFDVVYTTEDRKIQPRAMENKVIALDPFKYPHYPDSPPTSPNPSPVIATDTVSAISTS